MSAIVGLLHLQHQSLSPALGPGIMEALTCFPADYTHELQHYDVFLGCHGQWVTPESLHEILPTYHAESSLSITADAIIDNRSELFERLQIAYSDQKEMTDSMLILRAYLKWGEDCLHYLIGDFSFIIWDSRNQSMFVARDFAGTRTLYVTQTDEWIGFCTTIRPLFTLPGVSKELNEQWLSEFLAIPITTEAVDLFSTVYKYIGQVPPSHCFTVREGKIKYRHYGSIFPKKKLKLKSNLEYVEAFQDVFDTAIASKLRTYRNVGANLSGGLDSGSVVSFAARALRKENKKLHTFSYVPLDNFQDWTPKSRVANERSHIQETVNHVGNIHGQYFDFADKNPYSEVDRWLEMMETPYKFYENSFWINGIYEQASKVDAGVLLSGSRGNWTISWGPALDYHAELLRNWKWPTLYKELSQFSHNTGIPKSRFYHTIAKKAYPGLAKRFSNQVEEHRPDLINHEFAERTQVYQRLEQHGYDFWGDASQSVYDVRRSQFEKLYYWTITGTMGCKQSLRHSLWERDATNDLRVVQFCLSLPESQFVQNGYDRSLIRRSTEHYLPDKVRLNQLTRGIQGADGLQRMLPNWEHFISELEQVITDPRMNDYLNTKDLRKSLTMIQHNPSPELVFKPEFRTLMRSLIFNRFIQKHA